MPNAIAGELCEIQITKAAKTWAAGRIYKILEVSPHRANRACPQSKLCGGCAFQHMDYLEECRLKAERVRQTLNRLGGEAQMENFSGQLKKYKVTINDLLAENEQLEARAKASEKGKMKDTMERAKLESELHDIQQLVDRIPPEVLAELKRQQRHTRER